MFSGPRQLLFAVTMFPTVENVRSDAELLIFEYYSNTSNYSNNIWILRIVFESQIQILLVLEYLQYSNIRNSPISYSSPNYFNFLNSFNSFNSHKFPIPSISSTPPVPQFLYLLQILQLPQFPNSTNSFNSFNSFNPFNPSSSPIPSFPSILSTPSRSSIPPNPTIPLTPSIISVSSAPSISLTNFFQTSSHGWTQRRVSQRNQRRIAVSGTDPQENSSVTEDRGQDNEGTGRNTTKEPFDFASASCLGNAGTRRSTLLVQPPLS